MVIFRPNKFRLIFLILLQVITLIKGAEKIKSEVRTFELKMHQHITRSDDLAQNASGLADDNEQMQSAMSGKLLHVNKNGPNTAPDGIDKRQIKSNINQNIANESRNNKILPKLAEDTEPKSGRRIVNGRVATKNTFKYQVIFS